MAARTKVRLESTTDRWRFTCPRGHRSWEPTNHHFWCQQCSHSFSGVDPEFDALRDKKTGALITRDQLFLVGYDG